MDGSFIRVDNKPASSERYKLTSGLKLMPHGWMFVFRCMKTAFTSLTMQEAAAESVGTLLADILEVDNSWAFAGSKGECTYMICQMIRKVDPTIMWGDGIHHC